METKIGRGPTVRDESLDQRNPDASILAETWNGHYHRWLDVALGLLANNYRRCKRLFQRPSNVQASPDIRVSNLEIITRLTQRALKPKTFDLPIVPAGVVLFLPCLPLAILWLIASIGINPSKSQTFGPISHIGQEVCEQKPSFADSNPAPPVMAPVFIGWLSTSLDHVEPANERAGNFASTTMAVFNSRFRGLVVRFFAWHSVASSMLC